MRMEKLFTYGTLQDPETQKQVLGRTLGGGVPDTLLGYRLARLNGIHFVYSILQPHSGSRVEGLLVEVSGEELEKAGRLRRGSLCAGQREAGQQDARLGLYRESQVGISQPH